jgi:hypothetical protein
LGIFVLLVRFIEKGRKNERRNIMKLQRRIKIASSAFFAFSLVSLVCLASPEPQIRFVTPFVALIFVGLGFLTLKLPTILCGLGGILFGLVFLESFVDSLRTGLVFENPLGFWVITLLLAYMVVVLIQGFFAGIKLLIQEEKFLKAVAVIWGVKAKKGSEFEGKGPFGNSKNE